MTAAQRHATPRRRRRWWSLVIAIVAALVVVLAADVLVLTGQLERIPLQPTTGGDRETWLIVGVDDRSAKPDGPDDYGGAGPGARADIAIVATRSGDQWQLLMLPRDLALVSDHDGMDRLSAVYLKGAQEVVNRLCFGFKIPIRHVVQFNFRGFVETVDALGGVDVTVGEPLRDKQAHLELVAGTHRLDGRSALALVRSRQAEVLRDGQWVHQTSAAGAAARQRNAGHVMTALAASLRSVGPIGWQRAAWAVSQNTVVDEHTTYRELLSLRTISGTPTELPVPPPPGDSLIAVPDQRTYQRLEQLGFTDCRLS